MSSVAAVLPWCCPARVDEADRTRWTIRLRFHDGSAVDADAVVWNLEKVFNKAAPQYAPAVVAQLLWRVPGTAGCRKIDDMTVPHSPP